MRYVSGDRDKVTHRTKKDGGVFDRTSRSDVMGFFFCV